MNWQLLARANTHPLRISILEVLDLDDGRTLSPKDLSLELQAPLSTVNYHATELARAGLIEIVDERQVRGAVEHFYRVVERSTETASQKHAHRNGSRSRGGGARLGRARRGAKRTTGLELAARTD